MPLPSVPANASAGLRASKPTVQARAAASDRVRVAPGSGETEPPASVPARMVLGSEGSTARLQILPEPRPDITPAVENPGEAAETGRLSAPHPSSAERASTMTPSHRLRRRRGRVADGEKGVG